MLAESLQTYCKYLELQTLAIKEKTDLLIKPISEIADIIKKSAAEEIVFLPVASEEKPTLALLSAKIDACRQTFDTAQFNGDKKEMLKELYAYLIRIISEC